MRDLGASEQPQGAAWRLEPGAGTSNPKGQDESWSQDRLQLSPFGAGTFCLPCRAGPCEIKAKQINNPLLNRERNRHLHCLLGIWRSLNHLNPNWGYLLNPNWLYTLRRLYVLKWLFLINLAILKALQSNVFCYRFRLTAKYLLSVQSSLKRQYILWIEEIACSGLPKVYYFVSFDSKVRSHFMHAWYLFYMS